MSLGHHPSEAALMDHASGALTPGARLVVTAHLETCPSCRQQATMLEAVGGHLLATLPDASLGDDALARVFARIERPQPAEPSRAAPISSLLDGVSAPAALRRATIGPARWIAPGVRTAAIREDRKPGARAYLLRVDAGMRLPRHGHGGQELTLVLSGSYTDAFGRFGPGDLAEAGENDEHEPIVSSDGPCVCLIASEAPMRMNTLIGRLFQPLMGV